MSTMAHARGAYAPGTMKRSTVNMYDGVGTAHFQPSSDGPFEAQAVTDQPSAQDHFNATREIKLRRPLGQPLPPSTYRQHYPAHPLPELEQGLQLNTGTAPFTARTEHNDQFYDKNRNPRPVDPLKCTFKPGLWMGKETTNQGAYKPFRFDPSDKQDTTRYKPREVPTQNPHDFSTTYGTQFPAKEAPGREPVGEPQLRAHMPDLSSGTTYGNHYVPKELALQPVFRTADEPYPFKGTTEYRAEYPHKEAMLQVPPLTGIVAREGLQLPLPRKSLGVEFWHKGQTDKYYVLIPRHMDVPCSATQIFTTVHDNQEQACILVLYGDDPVASNNMLLGQFDIVNIPPAPKDVPQIEVKFHLGKDMILTAEARDLDTERHKLWIQKGEIIVLKQ